MAGVLTWVYGEPHPDERERNRSIGWFVTTFTLVLIFIFLASLVIAASNGRDGWAPNFATFLGLSLLTSATGFAGGGFVGFLFGVPRMQTAEARANAPVASNTNLEQVSDWLTKIIVGVSLVQFDEVGQAIYRFRREVDGAIGSDAGPTGIEGAGFAIALILIGSAVAGFLAAYLKSKTDPMTAFAPKQEVESKLGAVIAEQIMGGEARRMLDRPGVEPEKCSREMAARLIQLVPASTRDYELHQLLGLAHVVLGNFQASADSFRTAIDLARIGGKTPPSDLLTLTARALAMAGDVDNARALAVEGMAAGKRTTAQTAEQRLAEIFTLLYTRDGHGAAIEKARKLLQDSTDMARSGRLWLYLAAAQGQRHAALVQTAPEDVSEIMAARNDALAASRKAIQLDPSANGPVLRSLWDKRNLTKDPRENDLESLYDDPDFQALMAERVR